MRPIATTVAATACVLLAVGLALGTDIIVPKYTTPIDRITSQGIVETKADLIADPQIEPDVSEKVNRGDYNCQLRIFMNEPYSRYKDYSNFYHYEFGFLDFAFNGPITVPYLSTYTDTIRWIVPAAFDTIGQNNIAATVAVFDLDNPFTAYSDPPNGFPFTAYNVDATAIATDGNPGANTSDGSSTHTVFIEEGTSTT